MRTSLETAVGLQLPAARYVASPAICMPDGEPRWQTLLAKRYNLWVCVQLTEDLVLLLNRASLFGQILIGCAWGAGLRCFQQNIHVWGA